MRPFPRLIPRSVCSTPNVTRAVKRVLLRGATKAGGGGLPVCKCEYEENAYNEMSGATSLEANPKYTNFNNGETILSQAITITEDCCVLAVGTIISKSTYSITNFELERPKGTIVVDQEHKKSTYDCSLYHYASWEVLPAGNYTFFLVNRYATLSIYGAQLKIVAFSCTGPPCACQYHASAYNEFSGTLATFGLDKRYTSFADDATILSQAITITEDCCVLAVGTLFSSDSYVATDFELEQPLGTIVVDQEHKTTTGDEAIFHYAAWEPLTAGVYTYNLVNRAGAARNAYATQLKIIAVHCALG